MMTVMNAQAGGILTNTNQSVAFLKNPARDAAIGLDGVYSNPAGVIFMPEGFHIALNWQYAHQTRTITSTNPAFSMGKKNDGKTTKTFEGIADAPFIPSLQAAYNKGDWSIQFNFSLPGGGGVCEYENGLGSFESSVGTIAQQLKAYGLGVEGYDVDAYMRGRQYFFGFQLGAAYKINEHWSVYGGLRALYGNASYKARLNNIQVGLKDAAGEMYWVNFDRFINDNIAGINNQLGQAEMAYNMVETFNAMGQTALANMLIANGAPANAAQLAAYKSQGQAGISRLETLQKYSQGVNLMSNQEGFGLAPIIGVDYKVANFNFAAKYEFNTEMKMKNRSTVDKAMEIESVNKFKDESEVDEDAPALLTLGAQWTVIPEVNLNVGYHHYYDKNAHWYNNSQEQLSGGTNEYLAGVEWNVSDRVNLSCGGQLTRYGLTDEYMNDMSFVVNSYSVGAGITYQATDHLKVSIAYFQTNYSDYNRTNYPAAGVSDSFTRTNRVLGLGCQLDF